MKIKWLGHSAFEIKTEEITIVHDPYKNMLGYKLPKTLLADIVISSHEHSDHNYIEAVSGDFEYINTAGIHEFKGVKIEGVSSFHDDKKGQERGKNIIFKYTIDGITIAHLGDLGHILDDGQKQCLQNVDILLIPCGGRYTIGSEKALEIITQINPKITIPMHYRTKALLMFGFKFEKVSNLTSILNKKINKVKILEITKEQLPKENEVYILSYINK